MNDPVGVPGDRPSVADASDAAPSARRRALLVAMPSIVSLHPGVAAAGARSSNLLVLADGAPVEDGKYLCVKKPWGAKQLGKGWDLGDDPWIDVAEIPADRSYYKRTWISGHKGGGQYQYTPVDANEMCRTGGEFYYKQRNHRYAGYDGMETTGGDTEDLQALGGELQAPGDVGDVSTMGGGDGGGGDKDWKTVKVPKGAMVSATALASFAHCTTRYEV